MLNSISESEREKKRDALWEKALDIVSGLGKPPTEEELNELRREYAFLDCVPEEQTDESPS